MKQLRNLGVSIESLNSKSTEKKKKCTELHSEITSSSDQPRSVGRTIELKFVISKDIIHV